MADLYEMIDSRVLVDLSTHTEGLEAKLKGVHTSHIGRDVPAGEKLGKGYGAALADAVRTYMDEEFIKNIDTSDNLDLLTARRDLIEGLVDNWFRDEKGKDLRTKYEKNGELAEKDRDLIIQNVLQGLQQYCIHTAYRGVDTITEDSLADAKANVMTQNANRGIDNAVLGDRLDTLDGLKTVYKKSLPIWLDHEMLLKRYKATIERNDEE